MDPVQPLHITEAFGLTIDEKDLDFFDANLYYDSLLFLDPFLLKRSPVEEEKQLFDRFGSFFKSAYYKSLDAERLHQAFEDLIRFFSFKEPKEINLGYTSGSNSGSGLGPEFAKSLIDFFLNNTAKRLVIKKEIYPEYKFNPLIFSIFADGLGPDGISDLTANLIMDYLISYTQKQAQLLGIDLKILPVGQTFDFEEQEWTNGINALLPENPIRRGTPIVFVPKRLLRSFNGDNKNNTKGKIVGILREDPILKDRFSNLILKPIEEIDIEEIRNVVLQEDSIIFEYLTRLEKESSNSYDFNKDILAFLSIKRFKDFFKDSPLKREEVSTCSDLLELTQGLIQEVKSYLEKIGWRDMWNGDRPGKEEVFGRIFRAMGLAYFARIPVVTFDPEVNTGRGELDFRVLFKDCKIAIELKNLCNSASAGEPALPAYIHGMKIQLPIYALDSKAKYAFYITGQHYKEVGVKRPKNHDNRANELRNLIPEVEESIRSKLPSFQTLFYENFDFSVKQSASEASHI